MEQQPHRACESKQKQNQVTSHSNWSRVLWDKLLKNDSTDKEKKVSNIRPDDGVSPETSSPKLNIEIVGNSMINDGINPVGLSSKCKHRFRIKPYGGAIS